MLLRIVIITEGCRVSFYTSTITDLDAHPPTPAEEEATDRLTPVALRLDRVLSSIPLAVQRKGIPLAMIQQRLKGRTKGMAHPGEVSSALLKRGWTRRVHAELRSTGQCSTLWYPPGVDPVKEAIAARLKLPRGRPPKWLAHARKLAREAGLVF